MIEPQTVYTFCVPWRAVWRGGDVIGHAAAEKGGRLVNVGGHISSTPTWAMQDLASAYKTERYEAALGGPVRVEWVDDPMNHPVLAPLFAEPGEGAERP